MFCCEVTAISVALALQEITQDYSSKSTVTAEFQLTQIVSVYTCAAKVLKAALCFNIDPVAWKTLSNSAAGFGYQVVQRLSDLMVSAPLEQLSPNERGQIFKCSTKDCTPVPVPVPSFAVNMSLGLTMTSDPNTQKTLACGPTIPKDCKSITQYSGVCFEIDSSDHVRSPVPSSIEECRTKADIAFLLDGSGSVEYNDFQRMKDFVKSVVKSFPGKDTQFAIAQFSSRVDIHYYFNTFNADDWESQINGIRQLTGGTQLQPSKKLSRAIINYTFTLDAQLKVPNNRAYIRDKQREQTGTLTLTFEQKCNDVKFLIQACPDDSLNPVNNELQFIFDGLPSSTGLRPSLAQQAQTTIFHPLVFEINCGTDNDCVEKLKVDFNFSREVYITEGIIECNSLDSGARLSQGRTDCTIDKHIFKSNTKVLFIVSYGIDTTYKLDRTLIITANATSSLSYTNFSHGKNDLQKPVQQPIVLANDNRVLNLTMVIRVPVKLGDKDIWVNSTSLQIPDCHRDKDEKPTVTNFVAEIQTNKSVDCSVAWCRVFKCNRFMGSLERQTYTISANLSSGWIEQIGLKSARFLLTSTATLEFDRNQYIFFLPGSNNNPLVHKVEVYPEPDFTREIVRGFLGGLALLILLTAALTQGRFLNNKYKNMMNEGQEAGEEAEEGESAPEYENIELVNL
ncbi:integrin alpha-M-like [Scomber scombrus]|uniref:Integrin alpha-M-like n=1 Tax=Scomber scombrus TaxID=13677 RepID=A0AAV1PKH8_SCOSC